MRSRRLRLVLLGLPVLLLIVAAGFFASARSAFPSPDAPSARDAEALRGVVGIPSGGSCVWMVPADNGAVLIDAGGDAQAPAVVAALRGIGVEPEAVQGILLTHASPAHLNGAARFPGANLYVGPGEGVLVRQERPFRTRLGRLAFTFTGTAPPKSAGEVESGALLTLGGHRFRVVSAPGHTLGSTAYLLDDRILFTGDALLVEGERLVAPPGWSNEDPEKAKLTAEWVKATGAPLFADGHCRVHHTR